MKIFIRRLYDICLILKHDKYRDFISSNDFKELMDVCILDEKIIFSNQSNCFDNPIKEAPLFSEFKNWLKPLESTYNGIFADLVYKDLPTMAEIDETLDFIRDSL